MYSGPRHSKCPARLSTPLGNLVLGLGRLPPWAACPRAAETSPCSPPPLPEILGNSAKSQRQTLFWSSGPSANPEGRRGERPPPRPLPADRIGATAACIVVGLPVIYIVDTIALWPAQQEVETPLADRPRPTARGRGPYSELHRAEGTGAHADDDHTSADGHRCTGTAPIGPPRRDTSARGADHLSADGRAFRRHRSDGRGAVR